MSAALDTACAPWHTAILNDTQRAQLNIVRHVLGRFHNTPRAHRDIVLPSGQRPAGYPEPGPPLRHIPTPF